MTETAKTKAIFLDRDGTIIQDNGYIKDISDVEFFADTVSSLKRLQTEYELFIVTNQSGVGKGLISMQDVERINGYIDSFLKENGINIRRWYVCPHEGGCSCKKPSSYFIEKAAEDFGIVPALSFAIGDHPHDIEFAENGGACGFYVLTGHGSKHLADLPLSVPVFHNLSDAANRIMKPEALNSNNFCSIDEASDLLRSGGVAAFPTETVYGLGADVFNPEAIAMIFKLKGRPLFNPLIAHITDLKMLDRLTADVSDTARKLMEKFWPGPLTLVFPKKDSVPDIVTGGNPTVAVRMPAHPMALELIKKADTPIAAPSANAFGKTSPTTAVHVIEQLGDRGYKIIDGGASRVGVESTVLSLVHERPVLLRPGGLSAENIEEVIGKIEIQKEPKLKNLESPGLLASHYSPHTPFILADGEPQDNDDPETGLLLFKTEAVRSTGPVEVLSKSGSADEAAVNLYAAMRRLDKLGLKQIIAYRLPEQGLGKAVNDRISKAATPAEDSAST